MAHEKNIAKRISGNTCSVCGGAAPDWKCPKCGTTSKSFDPSHWRVCRYGAKMQAQCSACGEAEEKCTCLSKRKQGGYVDLLIGVLVTAFIIGFLYVRWWSAPLTVPQPEESVQPLTASGTVPTTQYEKYQADLDAAEALQDSVDVNTSKLENALAI
jgi:hypothetical protein